MKKQIAHPLGCLLLITLATVFTIHAAECTGRYMSSCDGHGPVDGPDNNKGLSTNTASGVTTTMIRRQQAEWKTKNCALCSWNNSAGRCEDDDASPCPDDCTQDAKYGEMNWDGTQTLMAGTVTINIGVGGSLNLSLGEDVEAALARIRTLLGITFDVNITTTGTVNADGSGNVNLGISYDHTTWDDQPSGWDQWGDCNH